MKSITMCAAAVALGVCAQRSQAQESMYVLTDFLFPQLAGVNPQTGGIISSVPVTGHQALFGGLAVDDARDLYSIDGYNDENPDRTFRINIDTGAGVVVGPTGLNWNFRTVCVNPVDDVLYAATDNPVGGVYTLSRTTGAATLVAGLSGPAQLDQLTAIAINAQGQAFATDIGDTSLFSLNLQTGQLTFIANVGQSGNWFEDLAFDGAGTLWGVRQAGGVFTINTATGAETFRFGGAYRGLVFVPDSCYPDCDGLNGLTVQDFGCFQTKFVQGDPYADCDGVNGLTVQDFGCFQTRFVQGCR